MSKRATSRGNVPTARSTSRSESIDRSPARVFLLSPAYCGGIRAGYLMNPKARFPLAVRLRTEGATIGEVFTFASGLYFRGKAAYAAAFGRPPRGVSAGLVVVPGEGLVDIDARIGLKDLKRMATIPVDPTDSRFLKPLLRDAGKFSTDLGMEGEAVLLGSVATGKYREPLLEVLGERLLFPTAFIGRGDMSRGALMLRSAESGEELAYQPVLGANFRGARAPKLSPRNRTGAGGPDELNDE